MPHFPIKKDEIFENIVQIKDVDLLRHLVSALRLKEGEKVKFIDNFEMVYLCKVLKVDKKYLEAEILNKTKSKRKLNLELYLAQSLLRGDAQTLAIQNAVQAGVKGVYPVISDNCAVRAPKSVEKLQKAADESFKQCERADKAKIFEVQKMEEVLDKFKNIIIFAEKYADISIKDTLETFDKKEKILVVIGPEGGFSAREFELFKKKKYNLISLGNLIYKAPNAITAGISNIIYELGR